MLYCLLLHCVVVIVAGVVIYVLHRISLPILRFAFAVIVLLLLFFVVGVVMVLCVAVVIAVKKTNHFLVFLIINKHIFIVKSITRSNSTKYFNSLKNKMIDKEYYFSPWDVVYISPCLSCCDDRVGKIFFFVKPSKIMLYCVDFEFWQCMMYVCRFIMSGLCKTQMKV